MSDEIVTIIGLREVLTSIRGLGELGNTKPLMEEIGLYFISQIQIRTAEGKDAEGRDFDPYSPAYAAFRRSKKHSADKVNLFFTGSMMSSMTEEASDNEVKLFFQNTSDKTGMKNPEKAFYLNENREFFAVPEEDRQYAINLVEDYINNILRNR